MDDIVATMKVIRTGAYALIKKDNKVLLDLHQDGPYQGLWDLPGLKIDAGETPEETIKRLVEGQLHGSFASEKLKYVWTATFEQANFLLHQIAAIYEIEGYNGAASGWTDLATMPDHALAPLALKAKLIK